MLKITRNTFNNKFFCSMQKDELIACMQIIRSMTDAYKPSISGICISDQEEQKELWAAWQTANYNLSKLS